MFQVRLFLVALLFARAACGADVRIENPKGLAIDQVQVNVLYTMTCQEVASAYHVRNYSDLQVPLTLVLGGDDERYTIDHGTGAGTVYLRHWDDQLFVAAAVMIAYHHVLSDQTFRREVTKILTRFNKVKPQTVADLRRKN